MQCGCRSNDEVSSSQCGKLRAISSRVAFEFKRSSKNTTAMLLLVTIWYTVCGSTDIMERNEIKYDAEYQEVSVSFLLTWSRHIQEQSSNDRTREAHQTVHGKSHVWPWTCQEKHRSSTGRAQNFDKLLRVQESIVSRASRARVYLTSPLQSIAKPHLVDLLVSKLEIGKIWYAKVMDKVAWRWSVRRSLWFSNHEGLDLQPPRRRRSWGLLHAKSFI